MVTDEQQAGVTRALRATFGATACDEIGALAGRPGSNRAFRIVVRGTAYLLRINTRPGDMARHFSCMQAAAEAGLAPSVRYASVEDRISITDFVCAIAWPARDAMIRVPAALRTLHALAPFPAAPFNTTCMFLLNAGVARDELRQRFRASRILAANEANDLLSHCQQMTAAYACPRRWRRAITTCSSRTTCFSTADKRGWRTGKRRSRTTVTPVWRRRQTGSSPVRPKKSSTCGSISAPRRTRASAPEFI